MDNREQKIGLLVLKALNDMTDRQDERRHDCPCCTDVRTIIEKALMEVIEIGRRTENKGDTSIEGSDSTIIEEVKPDLYPPNNNPLPPTFETPEG